MLIWFQVESIRPRVLGTEITGSTLPRPSVLPQHRPQTAPGQAVLALGRGITAHVVVAETRHDLEERHHRGTP